ncbi:TolC family protein [Planctomycetaceae bacterium]|nr:TolC family protein [Planctomycetaceae bacterium]
MSNQLRLPKIGLVILLLSTLLTGCWERRTGLSYLGEGGNQYYKDVATSIDYPDATQESPQEVLTTAKPRTIRDRSRDEIWEMPLTEAVTIALENNRVIRTDATFLNPGSAIFTNPDRTASIYDPAIQESGVLFGGRGSEAALSAFDARWDTRMLWGRNSTYNNIAAAPGSATSLETANFNTSLTKAFGYGGQVEFGHNVDYLGSNSAGQLFPSTYTGSLSAEYRQPLLAGSGAEYTSIAGPITQSFGGITGVNQGVVIARINNDITLADLEANIRNLVLDVEVLYWDLYLAYVQFDTATQARESARQTWQIANAKVEEGDVIFPDMGDASDSMKTDADGNIQRISNNVMQGQNTIPDLYQAKDAYYQAQTAVDRARSLIYSTETRFRRLLGLAVNDGRIVRPQDEPLTGEYVPDWYSALADALTHRVELRRQKWNVKSLELQLTAAKSLTRPRLDFVTSARMNGLGDDLIGSGRADGVSPNGLDNLYGTLGGGDTSGWGAGIEMSVPIGFRSALAQVRNIELRISKAREVLSVQEMDISQEIAISLQDIALNHANMKSLLNRKEAARLYEEKLRIQLELGGRGAATDDVDRQIRAIATLADAENAYFQSLVQYNQSLAQYHSRKGTLLAYNNIHLAENQWDPAAYEDALRRARERGHAFEDRLIEEQPRAFSMGSVNPHELEFRSASGQSEMVPLPEAQDSLPPAPQEPIPSPPVEESRKAYDSQSVRITPPQNTMIPQSVPVYSRKPRSGIETVNSLLMFESLDRQNVTAASHETVQPGISVRHPLNGVPGKDTPVIVNQNNIIEPSTPQSASAQKTGSKFSLPQWPGTAAKATTTLPPPVQAREYKEKTPFAPQLSPYPAKQPSREEEWHPLNLGK